MQRLKIIVFILKASPVSANDTTIFAWKKDKGWAPAHSRYVNPKTDCSIEFLIPKNP